MLTAKQSQPENNAARSQSNSPFFSQHMVQAKLEVNEPGDRFEQEADVMADRVMRMSIPSMGGSAFFSSAETGIQRKCQHCEEEEKLQRKESSDAAVQGSSELDSYVGSLGSSGQAMPESSRQFFEPRFGHNFSNVRIHTDSVAAKSAQSINALAYTSGNNIVFNSGQFSPESDSGKRLMAHELTHVMQQGSGIATKKIQRAGNPDEIPPMACDPANSSPSPSVLSSSFATSATELTPAQRTDIANFAASWSASGGTDALRIDGYASTPGTDQLNWQLSCSRAISVANELRNNGVPDSMMSIFAHGETSEFGSQLNNQVANISMANPTPTPPVPPVPIPPVPIPPVPVPPVPVPPVPVPPIPVPPIPVPPVPVPPVPVPPGPAPNPTPTPAPVITSETLVEQPAPITRTTIGVGEEVQLTHSSGNAATAWVASAGTFDFLTGSTVNFTAPDTAQTVIITAGGAMIVFTIIAPTGIHMDRAAGTPIKHTVNTANSGMNTAIFLLPDTVNFSNVIHHEIDIVGVPTNPGVYSCNPFRTGHCGHGGSGPCNDIGAIDNVIPTKGTQTNGIDCVYSGHCGGSAPFTPGSVTISIPYEYKVGTGAFHQFATVVQSHTLAADGITLSSDKAGAHVDITVAAASSGNAGCP